MPTPAITNPEPVGSPVPAPLPPAAEPNTKPPAKPKKPAAKKNAAPPQTPPPSPPAETTPPTSPPSKASNPQNGKPGERPVIYNEIKLGLRLIASGKGFDAAVAKKYLGWMEETKEAQFKERFAFKDRNGVKIRCQHNDSNRPIRWHQVETLIQEILRRRWKFNGEPLIVGVTGRILDGQHTLIAVVLATQEWENNPEKWKPYWETPPAIDKAITLGVAEDDETVNTIDTGIPRSLADVIARSPYFTKFKKSERVRVKLAQVLDHAVRQLWDRTGADDNAYAAIRTHSESLAFMEAHPKLEKAVAHIWEQNGDKNDVKRFCPLGYASALLYLMGAALTQGTKPDGSGYLDKSDRSETLLDFSLWEKALDFWEAVAERSDSLAALFKAFEHHFNEGQASTAVKIALLIKAWNLYADDKKVTEKGLTLTFAVNDDGLKKIAERPTLGGIDVERS